ncbi:MAG: hypothetical protein KIT84_18240 [Labilithrix sp.]|nr:hypothetical protein [Labilithrix sp.]MCW5812973.1 hypothetical protein [Labilithrix sp.]
MRRLAALFFAASTWIVVAPAAAAGQGDPVALEEEYKKTKNAKLLLNAARAHQKRKAPAKAANDYAAYLSVAPEKERKDRAAAQKALNALGAKLGRFAIRATGSSKLAVDGETVDPAFAESWYVTPGAHKVEATFGARVATEQATAVKGELVAVVLAEPPEEAAPLPVPPPSSSSSSRGSPPTVKKSTDKFSLPPLAAYIGGGVTVLFGGLTVLSAIDVQNQKAKFDEDRSQQNLDDGKSKQLRTNVLLGFTAGFAVLTGVVAVVLVDWKRTDTKLGLGPGTVFLEGRF